MRLAMMTGVPSAKAALTDDAPEMVLKFANAYSQILGKTCPESILEGGDR
jgi:hypothetical protein